MTTHSPAAAPPGFAASAVFMLSPSDAPDAPAPQLFFFPNPARRRVHVLGADAEGAAEPLLVLDVRGRVRRRLPADAPLDVTSLPSGLYVVRQGLASGPLAVE